MEELQICASCVVQMAQADGILTIKAPGGRKDVKE